VKTLPEVTPGQDWAIRDRRYVGWRYVTVETVEDGQALVRPKHRNGRRSRVKLASFRRHSFCGHDGPGQLPPYTGSVANPCVNCPPKARVLPLERDLNVGFGAVEVTRDGEPVWFHAGRSDTRKRVAHMELRARETPGDWRIRFIGAMSEELYQRQPTGWVLVWRGFGFA
jgi:hypothetical protein